jgi:hypothetical protein
MIFRNKGASRRDALLDILAILGGNLTMQLTGPVNNKYSLKWFLIGSGVGSKSIHCPGSRASPFRKVLTPAAFTESYTVKKG